MIRKVGLGDLEDIRKIAFQSWEDAYSSILGEEQLSYMLDKFYSEDALRKLFSEKKQIGFILEYEGQSVGFAFYQTDFPEKKTCKIHKLYILPEFHGKGFGRMLIEKIIATAKEQSQQELILNVNKYNKAIRFYEKSGFKIRKEEVIPIGEGYIMDDYVMGMEL